MFKGNIFWTQSLSVLAAIVDGVNFQINSYPPAAEFEEEKELSDYRAFPAFVKVKPHGDVSFTPQISFYKQHTASAEIKQWIKSNKIPRDNLGIPRYLGSAQNEQIQNIPSDFLVLERYDLDLQTLLFKHRFLFPKPTVLKIAYHTVRVLEYFHQRDHVHGDVRACNIRMDLYDESIVYLLPQFRRTDESDRNAVAFWSEDRHCGALTKRGDFESLLYNLIDWSGGILPWKNAPPNEAKDMKIQAFNNSKQFLQDAFRTCKCDDPSGCLVSRKCTAPGKSVAPSKCLTAISELMDQVACMKETGCEPDYEEIRKILKKRLLNMYHVPASKLEFSTRTVIGDEDHDEKVNSYVPGLGITVDVLANIIAENYSSFDEVNMLDTKSVGVIVISKLKGRNRPDIIRKVWEENTLKLRTMVVKLWRSKQVKPGYYKTWKKKRQMAEKRASMKAKKKVVEVVDLESPVEVIDHESPAGVEDADKRNCDTPATPKDPNLDATNVHQSLQLTTQQTQKNGPDKSAQKERSLSPSTSRGVSSSPSELCQTLQDARSSSPSESNGVQSPISPAGSNGLHNPRSGQDGSHSDVLSSRVPEQFHENVDRQLPGDIVFETTEEAEITGEQVIRHQKSVSVDDEQWHDAYEWLDAWLGLKELMLKALGSMSSEPHLVGSQVQQLRVLSDEYCMQEPVSKLRRLVNVLSPDSADAQKLNRIQQRWLNQLVWLEESAQKLGDENLNQLHVVLQNSEILGWLVKELDGMPETLTISTDCVVFQQQREHYQMVYQRVMNNEAEVVKLLKRGLDVFTRSENLNSGTVQQLFFDVTQYQWNRLKTWNLDIFNKLQICHQYCQARNLFVGWLSKTEDKLESLKPISLNNIEEVLKELSSFTNEACEKAGEFAQMTKLEHKFVGVRDEDKDDHVKNRWAKLNTDLIKRKQSLEIIISFNTNLHDLKQKIELCEDGLASYDALGGAVKDPKLFNRIEELQKQIVCLQMPLDNVRQQGEDLLSKTREEGRDTSHLSNEMNRLTTRVETLKTKFLSSVIKIRQKQFVSVITGLQQTENVINAVRDLVEKTKVSMSKIISDLTNSAQSIEKLDFLMDIEATRQHVESLSPQENRLEQPAQTYENRLEEASKNDKQSSDVNALQQQSKEKSSEEKDDDSSESDGSDNSRNNKKTGSSKNKRKKYSSTSDSDSDYGDSRPSKRDSSRKYSRSRISSKRRQDSDRSNNNKNAFSSRMRRRRRRSQSQDSDFDLSRPSTSNDNSESHKNSEYDNSSKSKNSSKSSKTQNQSDSDLSPPRRKKSKHSYDSDDYDSDDSICLRQECSQKYSRSQWDDHPKTSQNSERSKASSISKDSDTQPGFVIKQEIKEEPDEISEGFNDEESDHIPRAIKPESGEINEGSHVKESSRMPCAIKLEPREINDSNVEEFDCNLGAIKPEPMLP